MLSFRVNVWYDGPVALLDELYVRPDMRGHRFGHALLETACRLARERGAETLEINVDGEDTDARRFYEAHGFANRTRSKQTTEDLAPADDKTSRPGSLTSLAVQSLLKGRLQRRGPMRGRRRVPCCVRERRGGPTGCVPDDRQGRMPARRGACFGPAQRSMESLARRASAEERRGRSHEAVGVVEPWKVACFWLNHELGVREQLGELGRDAGWRVHVGLSGEQQHRRVECGECRASGLRVECALGAEGGCGLVVPLAVLGRLVGLCLRIHRP